MDENEKIDEIKDKLLDRIGFCLDHMCVNLDKDIRCSMIIKNLVDSYDVLNNIYQEEI